MSHPQTPPPQTPMERQGALTRDLAAVLLGALELDEQWQHVGAAFLPHGEEWAGRIVVTDRDGASRGGDSVFAVDSQITLLLDALQHCAAEQRQAFVSLRLDASRPPEDPDRIRLGADLEYDRDPGDLDGIGGIDADYARALVGRVGAERVPAWVRERAAGE